MSGEAVEYWFYITLFCGLPLGVFLMILWAKMILPRLLKTFAAQKRVFPAGIGVHTLIFMIPGLLAFILCCVPVIYVGHLRKQRRYCLQVIEVNKGIAKDNPMLVERCGCFDLDELFAESKNGGD